LRSFEVEIQEDLQRRRDVSEDVEAPSFLGVNKGVLRKKNVREGTNVF